MICSFGNYSAKVGSNNNPCNTQKCVFLRFPDFLLQPFPLPFQPLLLLQIPRSLFYILLKCFYLRAKCFDFLAVSVEVKETIQFLQLFGIDVSLYLDVTEFQIVVRKCADFAF